ncbi:MAG: glycosyltransferase family 2 protein [Lachnospiraceae bacterium]|nr:glycosyltransferase family 2 protein [Lachnospiraceae bacterium]
MRKILSIIIPAYNCEKYLDKGLDSLIVETVIDKLDIIIVNDGSSDQTETIAKKYCELYPESIRVISQKNKGHGGALNTGCEAAKGKYLKVIDADDWVESKNLPEFIKKLEECESDVVLTHHYTYNISTKEIKKWKSYPAEFDRAYTFDEIMVQWKNFDRSLTFHGITYKTDFYHENGIELSEHVFYEDHEYATIPCCYAKTITPFDLFIYDYRIGDVEQSVSDENQLKRSSHTEIVLKRFVQEYPKLDLTDGSGGKKYYCMKVQGLLLSYLKTVLLVEKDKKRGRNLGESMMNSIKKEVPYTYELARKQYKYMEAMNYFHITKKTFEAILHSKIYNKLRHNHDFE